MFSNRTRHLRPGEVEPQPIEKALPSHVIKRSTSQEAESGQDDMTDGDTDVEEKLLRSTSPSPHESPKDVKVFIFNPITPRSQFQLRI